jgi:hypothetical protein
MFLGGRLYDFSRDRAPRPSDEPLEDPIGYVTFRDPNWFDGPWDLRYRMIDRALDSDHWLTMPELRKLVVQSEKWVVDRVVAGDIQAAMVRGSKIPLFRILDPAKVVREVFLETPKRPPTQARPARDRWDR